MSEQLKEETATVKVLLKGELQRLGVVSEERTGTVGIDPQRTREIHMRLAE